MRSTTALIGDWRGQIVGDTGNNELETRLGQAIAQQLHRLGVHDPQTSVERRPKLPRAAGGKLKLVIADPATRPVHTNAR